MSELDVFINDNRRLAGEIQSSAKINESIVWESMGYMEFTIQSIIAFIITYTFSCLLCISKNDTNICVHFFLSRGPIFKQLPARHQPWLTSQVGFAKPSSEESWNIRKKWHRFARRILSDKIMEMSPRSPWISSSLPWDFFPPYQKRKERSLLNLPFKVLFFHTLMFLNSRCIIEPVCL